MADKKFSRSQARDKKLFDLEDIESSYSEHISEMCRISAQSGYTRESTTHNKMRLRYERSWQNKPFGHQQVNLHAESFVKLLDGHGYFALPPVPKMLWIPVAVCDYILCGKVRQIHSLPVSTNVMDALTGKLYAELKAEFFLQPETMNTRKTMIAWMCCFDGNIFDLFHIQVPEQYRKGTWVHSKTLEVSCLKNGLAAFRDLVPDHQSIDFDYTMDYLDDDFTRQNYSSIPEHQGKDDEPGILEKMKNTIGSIVLSSVVQSIRASLLDAFEAVKKVLGNGLVQIMCSCILLIIVWSALGVAYYVTFRDSEWGIIANLFFKSSYIKAHNASLVPEHQGKDESGEEPPTLMFDLLQTAALAVGGKIDKGVKTTNSLAKLGSNIKNIESLLTFVVTNVTKLIDEASTLVHGVPFFPTARAIHDYKMQYEKWLLSLKKLRTLPLTADVASEVVEIYDKMVDFREFVSKPCNKDVSVKLGQMIDFELRQFRELYEESFKIKFAPKPKPEPVWIELIGEAGKGKSFFIETLLKSISQEVYHREYKDTDRFAMNLDDAYTNGWRNQPFTVIDEHLSFKTQEAREVAAKTILKLINVAPHPLVCAALEDKGKHYFTSDFVITSSNSQPYPVDLGLTDHQAYYRRRALVVQLAEREGNSYTFNLYPSKKEGGPLKFYTINEKQLLTLVLESHRIREENFQKLQSVQPITPAKTDIRINSHGLVDFSMSPLSCEPITQSSEDTDDEEFDDVVESFTPITIRDWAKEKLDSISVEHALTLSNFDWAIPREQSIINLNFDQLCGAALVAFDQASFLCYKESGERSCFYDVSTKKFLKISDPSYFAQSVIEVPAEHQGLFDYVSGAYLKVKSYISPLLISEKRKIFEIRDQVKKCAYKDGSFDTLSATWNPKKTLETYVSYYSDRMLETYEVCDFLSDVTMIFKNVTSFTELYKILPPDVRLRSIHLTRLFSALPPLSDSPLLRTTVQSRDPIYQSMRFISEKHGGAVYSYNECVAHGFPLSSETDVFTLMDYWHTSWLSKFFVGESMSFLETVKSPSFWLGATAVTAALVGITVGIWKAMSGMGFAVKTEIQHQSDTNELSKMEKVVYRQRRRQLKRVRDKAAKHVEVVLKNVPQHQASVQIGLVEKIASNVDQIVVNYEEGGPMEAYCLFVTGVKCVAPYHMFHQPNRKVKSITFKWAAAHPITRMWSEYLTDTGVLNSKLASEDPSRDLIFLTVNTGQLFRSLLGPVYLPDKMVSAGTEGVTRIGFTESGMIFLSSAETVETFQGLTGTDGDYTDLRGCYKVPRLGGKRGLCGLPYYFNNTGVKGIVAGIHTSGTKEFSIVSPIYASDFEERLVAEHQAIFLGDPILPSRELAQADVKRELSTFEFSYHAGESPPGIRTIGETNFNFTWSPKTELRPSIVSGTGTFEELEAPAKLASFTRKEIVDDEEVLVVVSPLNNSFRKFEKKETPPPLPNLDKDKLYCGVFPHRFNKSRLVKLTYFQAINGVPEWDIKPLDMTKSPGVGWVNWSIRRSELVELRNGVEGYGYYPKSALLDQLHRYEVLIDQGGVPVCLALGLLKDEKRPLDRVASGNSRLYYAADFAHLIISRVYLGGLISATESDPVNSDISIGINVHSAQWKELCRRLCKPGRKLTSTDIEGWDINFLIYMVEHFVSYMRRRFVDISLGLLQGIRAMLLSSVQPFVFIGFRVFWMLIMCSGTLATSWFNSVVNSIVNRALFDLEVTPKTLVEYNDACDLTVHGDDNTQSVAELVQDLWNGVSIAAYRKKWCAWNSTAPDKSPQIRPFDTVEQTEYLKRGFRLVDDEVFPPLNKRTIESMCLWYRAGENPEKIQQLINFKLAMHEAAYHGQAYFDELKTKLQPFFQKLDTYYDESFVDLIHIWSLGQ